MPKRIVFTGKGQVELESYEPEPIRPGTVRVRTLTSQISTGTEGICFLRNFEPGTHWDDWVKEYPFRAGYIIAGYVSEIGPGVAGFERGQLVVTRMPHASDTVVDAKIVNPIPDDVDPEKAVWFALATVGFMGAKNGGFRLGDSIAFVGGGPIGQMALRWAIAAGARHAVMIDPVAWRLEHAKRGGATACIEAKADGCKEALLKACGGELPRIVVDCTGHAPVFEQCQKLVRDRGTLVILGDAGDPSNQRLSKEVIRRGLYIAGAHIMHEEGEWTEAAVVALFFDLVRRGRFSLEGLNTHVYKLEEYLQAYGHLKEGRERTMGIRFDWDGVL